jgi:hypothetical protein
VKIDRENYGSYFIDYFDGQLDPQGVAELMLFLEQHPDLKEEFESYDLPCLDPDHTCKYELRDQLKKSIIPFGSEIREDNYIQYVFDDTEGLLDAPTKSKLTVFLRNNPSLACESELLKLCRLEPVTIPFKNKEILKRTLVARISTQRVLVYAAAAMLAILFTVSIIWMFARETAKDPAMALQGNYQEAVPPRPVNDVTPQQYPDHSPSQRQDPLAVQQDLPQKEQLPEDEQKVPEQFRQQPWSMKTAPQLASLPEDQSSKRSTSPTYIRTFTEIMEMIALKQSLNKENNSASLADLGMGVVYKANGTADQKRQKNSFTFWDLAEIGVAGYNALSNKDVNFKRETDANGKTESFALGNLEYQRKK